MLPTDLGLPHRPPFLFVDKILSISSDEVIAEKTFSANDPIFAGHFPGNPIVPGVLLTEALAQAAGLVGGYGKNGNRFLLASIRSMKFPKAVRPEERIVLTAKKGSLMGNLFQFEVSANIEESIVAEGVVILCNIS